jgi:head-tail adaptor
MKHLKKNRAATGDLRFYLALERPETTPDDIGGSPLQSWTLITSLWCDIAPRSARERVVGAQLQEMTSHLIESHYWDNWKKGDRLSYTDANTSQVHYFKILARLNINQSATRLFWEAEEFDGSSVE